MPRHSGVAVAVGVLVGVFVAQPPIPGAEGVPGVVGGEPAHTELGTIAGGVPLGHTRLH